MQRTCRSEEGPPGTKRGRDLQTSGQFSTKFVTRRLVPKVTSQSHFEIKESPIQEKTEE